jgi:hypothetical protein
MARRTKRPPITRTVTLAPVRRTCSACGGTLWVVYETERTVTTLDDVCRLTLTVFRCHTPACSRYHQPYRPEAEGAWSLPHHEFGLDVIAYIGMLRYRQHRSVSEIHQMLRDQHVAIAPRTVSHLLARYEELLALRLADHARLNERLTEQGHVILALDGLQPHTHQDVLWVLRDCLSGEVLLARSLDRAREVDLAALLREVKQALPVPILAVVSDAQRSIRLAVQTILPDIPHQLCQYHYLKEAAKPITAADRHAKTELKKYVRGVRAIEETVALRTDTTAATIRGYCLAVHSALSDDGKPPVQLPGLAMHDRLSAIQDSLERVAEKKHFQLSWSSCVAWWQRACSPPLGSGRRCRPLRAGCSEEPTCWPTTRAQTRRR